MDDAGAVAGRVVVAPPERSSPCSGSARRAGRGMGMGMSTQREGHEHLKVPGERVEALCSCPLPGEASRCAKGGWGV